jgi:competence protein ComGC
MKAPFTLSSATDKALIILAFIPVLVWILFPTFAKAEISLQNSGGTAQVFEVKKLPISSEIQNSSNTDQSSITNTAFASISIDEIKANDLDYQTKLAYKELLRDYLAKRGSPFVNCVDIIVELKNADKVLSLANAESGLGKRYPVHTANAWGVGGSKLWKMGSSICEGVTSMDHFLSNYPRNSKLKYADMTIDQMNGLYKQPRREHWSVNNYAVLNVLAKFKVEAKEIAQAKISTPVAVATAELELASK